MVDRLLAAAFSIVVLAVPACGSTSVPTLVAPPVGEESPPPPRAAISGCGTALPAFAGRFCGPPDRPCVALRDETIDERRYTRNSVPSIALDSRGHPHVLYEGVDATQQGFYAARGDATSWSVETLPAPMAAGSIFLRDDDVP